MYEWMGKKKEVVWNLIVGTHVRRNLVARMMDVHRVQTQKA
jgi:hypothetical protein